MADQTGWLVFIVDVYGHTLTRDKVEKAKELHERAVSSLRHAQHELTVWAPLNWMHQAALLDARSSKALIEEIENYVRTKRHQGIADTYRTQNHPFYRAFAFNSYASSIMSSVYRLQEHEFTQQIAQQRHPPLEERRMLLRRRGYSPEAIANILSGEDDRREVYSIYRELNSLEASEEMRAFKAEVSRAKKNLPQPFHRLADMHVQMFWDEPREVALQYIRRKYPGPIGAFHGLPEPVGFKRPLK